MESIINIQLQRMHPALLQQNSTRFSGTEASKVANGGLRNASDASQRRQQARATLSFVSAKLPYTSPYTHALVRVPCGLHTNT